MSKKVKDGIFVPIVDMLPEDREYASAAGFEPKTIDELLGSNRLCKRGCFVISDFTILGYLMQKDKKKHKKLS